MIYFFCAWNLLAYVGYRYYKRDEREIKLNAHETLCNRIINKEKIDFNFLSDSFNS